MDAAWDPKGSLRVLVESDSDDATVDAEYKEIFEAYDSDGSGKINFSEMALIAHDAGIESRKRKHLFEEADKNKDGALSEEENNISLCFVIGLNLPHGSLPKPHSPMEL